METKTVCENHSLTIADSTQAWATNSALLLNGSEVCVWGAKLQPGIKNRALILSRGCTH